jgi:hypothetical protein
VCDRPATPSKLSSRDPSLGGGRMSCCPTALAHRRQFRPELQDVFRRVGVPTANRNYRAGVCGATFFAEGDEKSTRGPDVGQFHKFGAMGGERTPELDAGQNASRRFSCIGSNVRAELVFAD